MRRHHLLHAVTGLDWIRHVYLDVPGCSARRREFRHERFARIRMTSRNDDSRGAFVDGSPGDASTQALAAPVDEDDLVFQ